VRPQCRQTHARGCLMYVPAPAHAFEQNLVLSYRLTRTMAPQAAQARSTSSSPALLRHFVLQAPEQNLPWAATVVNARPQKSHARVVG
jgi:hypothetical protein